MERSYTVREMLAALGRRRWLALGVFLAALAVGAIAIALTPPEYVAQSVMQIEPHRLPPDFFPMPVTGFEDRMRTLKHGVLARPVLEKVLDESGFVPDWRRDPDEALESLRRATEVRRAGEVAGGPPSLLFVVEVRGTDREAVARAADLIPRTYAELTRDVLQTQAQNLDATLDRSARELAQRLQVEEGKLVAFKMQHALEVPEATEANLRAIGALNAQLDTRMAQLADAGRRKALLVALLPEVTSDAGYAGVNAEDVRRRLEAARAAYGDDHPDVRRLQRQYDEAASRSSTEQARFKKERIDAQLARIDDEVRGTNGEIAGLRREIQAVQRRVDAAPALGEQYRVLSRDYETLRAKYASTVSRVADAQAAQALLVADAPSMFRVVQAAVAPTRPAGPHRLDLALVALAVALGLALLAVAAAEYFDSSLRGAQDADAFGVPVLASIPRIGRAAGAR